MKKSIILFAVIFFTLNFCSIQAMQVNTETVNEIAPRVNIQTVNIPAIFKGYLIGVQTMSFQKVADKCGNFIDCAPEWQVYKAPQWKLFACEGGGSMPCTTIFRYATYTGEMPVGQLHLNIFLELYLVYYDNVKHDIVKGSPIGSVIFTVTRAAYSRLWYNIVDAYVNDNMGFVSAQPVDNLVVNVIFDLKGKQ